MTMVNIHEAKSTLSQLLARVEAGEDIVIARNGMPVARLVPIEPFVRKPGAAKGEIWIADDFDPTPEDVIAAFEGDA